jgi:hypothetical protein
MKPLLMLDKRNEGSTHRKKQMTKQKYVIAIGPKNTGIF